MGFWDGHKITKTIFRVDQKMTGVINEFDLILTFRCPDIFAHYYQLKVENVLMNNFVGNYIVGNKN